VVAKPAKDLQPLGLVAQVILLANSFF